MPTSKHAPRNEQTSARTHEPTPPQSFASTSALRPGFRPGRLSPSDMLAMQRTMGNRAMQRMVAQNAHQSPIQKKESTTGLPDTLKDGIENLSGYSLDDVHVHYNSDKPAQLQAHAYAQGTDIHIAPGQEQHLPHESWHVVQQAQGRVKPTRQMQASVAVSDDQALAHEADVSG